MTEIQLSPEQESILATAESPLPPPKPPPARVPTTEGTKPWWLALRTGPPRVNSKVVRVTAAAGTGKTTTLLHLAERCAELGHVDITYITFNRSAAADGKARFHKTLLGAGNALEARTLHGCAMMLLSRMREETFDEEQFEDKVINENELQAKIKDLLQSEINTFLSPCFAAIDTRQNASPAVKQGMKMTAEKQVVFYLFKTLTQFCHSDMSLKMFKDANTSKFQRNYYPIEKFHGRYGAGEKQGFSPDVYGRKGSLDWYPEQAYLLYCKHLKQVRNYDLEMKRAQLAQLEIPGTLLLVDECQDMDACQVRWISDQRLHKTTSKLIYLVGDAAQTIYGFRGAKSKFMMQVPATTNCTLTTSWRFGPTIATIANLILFAKENSPQTDIHAKVKTWEPYRVEGGSPVAGQVTADALDWKHDKVTLLAWKNATLFMAAIGLLGTVTPSQDTTQGMSEERPGVSPPALVTPEKAPASVVEDTVPPQMPKFHINGRGEASGMGKWKQVVREIDDLYRLFISTVPMKLPKKHFPELANESLTWETFRDLVESRELTKYASSILVISTYQDKTGKVVKQFRDEIMNKAYSPEEADVILSTCHAAKGMEWDNVQLCDDFTDQMLKVAADSQRGVIFDIQSWGDDVNTLYVACTRAKKLLSIPFKLTLLLKEFDDLKAFVEGEQGVKQEAEDPVRKKMRFDSDAAKMVPGLRWWKTPLSEEQSRMVYKCLVEKFRLEAKIPIIQTLAQALLSPAPTAVGDRETVRSNLFA